MRVLILFSLLSAVLRGQIDSALTIPLVGAHIGGDFPFADMSKRFGPNLFAGGTFLLKTKKNFIFGIESSYLFGRNVKEKVLSNLTNSDGFVVDNEGYPADLRITERALSIHAIFGKVLRFLSANPNSGLILSCGIGYFQNKVKIYDAQHKVASVKGDLMNGYDRFSGGPSISQFIGYLFLSEHRLVNFYFGFEFYEASTHSFRKLDYNTGTAETGNRLDIFSGFRAGWILPLYKKRPNDFYYN